MDIKPIGRFASPFGEKFGTPRQSGVAPSALGTIVLEPPYNNPDALRGLEGFDYLWILWEFSLNEREKGGGNGSEVFHATVRPPRLGGNERIGVFASRSPYRPNPIGLSSVRIESIDLERARIEVSGADLVDGTPIIDIKPYLPYTDAHPDAEGGYTDRRAWKELEIANPQLASAMVGDALAPTLLDALKADPRPHYCDDPDREYAFRFNGRDIRFRVKENILTIIND